MGYRTYIYNSLDKPVCVGKLIAYVDPKSLPNLQKWCDENITNEDDREYLFGSKNEDDDWDGFFNNGFCYENIMFNQCFNKEQIAAFITGFVRDKANGPFPLFQASFYEELGKLLGSDNKFYIEWVG